MEKLIFKALEKISKPFVGKGIIDRYFHFLIPIFEFLYSSLQKKEKIIVKVPLGLKLKVFTGDPGVGMQLRSLGKFEPTLTNLFLKTLRPGQTVFDIGANYGYYTLLASSLVGEDGRVFSFEADQENAAILQENLSLNNIRNVTIEQKAVSDEDSEVFFEKQRFNKGESAISTKLSGERVKSIALDSFSKKEKIGKIDILKIDVEGFEVNVLRGAMEIIKKSSNLALFIEYNPSRLKYYGFDPETLLYFLKELGFEIDTIVDESTQSPLPYSPGSLKRVLKRSTYCNLVCKKRVSD